MKLFIEVEISADELPLATELFGILRSLTDHVKTRDPAKLFHNLIRRAEDESQLDSVATDLGTLLASTTAGPAGNLAPLFDEFLSAFMEVVFSKELVARQQSVLPFMHLLPRLPEPVKRKMREALIPRVLKHLTIKRPVDTSRVDIFSHAEAFAALVNLEFVSITGAVATINTLLKKPDNRCAAITMLGKTVELCLPQLTQKCDPEALRELRTVLDSVTEDAFRYDIDYIQESMGWLHPSGSASGVTRDGGAEAGLGAGAEGSSLAGTENVLRAVDSYHGHCSTIFAMCYDEASGQLVSGGKDGKLIVWDNRGQPLETVEMADHYACSMDLHTAKRSLLVCGVAKEDSAGGPASAAPCISSFSLSGRTLKDQRLLLKESSKLVSCIKAMGQGSEYAFVTGETALSGDRSERVCYYDAQHASFDRLVPVRQYTEHDDLITCVSLFPLNDNIFMSGSRDATIRMWDRRTDRSVGMLGTIGKSGRIQAHDLMITCLDVAETNMVISAGMDAKVLCWDFRSVSAQGGSPPISSIQLDKSPVLKVALGAGGNLAALSTLRGLYLVDFTTPGLLSRLAEPFSDGRRVGRYHDLKWAHSRRTLFAAGDDTRVDVYALG